MMTFEEEKEYECKRCGRIFKARKMQGEQNEPECCIFCGDDIEVSE